MLMHRLALSTRFTIVVATKLFDCDHTRSTAIHVIVAYHLLWW